MENKDQSNGKNFEREIKHEILNIKTPETENHLDFSNQDLTKQNFSNRILIGANFTNSKLEGCKFDNADLSYANFTGANAYRASFKGSMLFVTRFQDCTLTRAVFDYSFIYGVEFIGNVNVTYCSFEKLQLEVTRRATDHSTDLKNHTEIKPNDKIVNRIASTKDSSGLDYKKFYGNLIISNGYKLSFEDYKTYEKEMQYSQIYNRLKRVHKENNFFTEAGHYYYLERQWERKSWFTKAKPLHFEAATDLYKFGRTIMAYIVEKLTGYGEKPLNLVSWILITLLVYAGGYTKTSFIVTSIDGKQSVVDGLAFDLSLYYSLAVFTTLGVGNINPIAYSKLLTATEAFIGLTLFALFTATIVRRMIRD